MLDFILTLNILNFIIALLFSRRWFMAIITVSRMYGAGGTTFAKKLSESIGYKYIDREYVEDFCKKMDQNICTFGLDDEESPDFLERLMELFTNKSFYKISLMATIYNLALQDNVLFCGRGANFILSGVKNIISFQIVGLFSDRVKAVSRIKNLDIEVAKELVENKDKERKEFIDYYYEKNIFDPLNYHMVINSSYVNLSESIEIAKTLLKKFDKESFEDDKKWLKNRLIESRANILLFRLGLVHGFGKINFDHKDDTIKVTGVIGSENDKRILFDHLIKIDGVKNIEDHLKVGILSHLIY